MNHLFWWLITNNLHFLKSFAKHQKMNRKHHDFRSGKSCLIQLLKHHNKILEELEKPNNVDVICLDFAKAFDKSTTVYYWTN